MMSVIYIFDVSAYPFTHIPFYFLTILYFASILEIYGMFRIGRWVLRRFPHLRRRGENLRALSNVLSHRLVDVAGRAVAQR